jgi:hypothetical protein
MDVSGQLHASAALHRGKEPPVHIEEEARWILPGIEARPSSPQPFAIRTHKTYNDWIPISMSSVSSLEKDGTLG